MSRVQRSIEVSVDVTTAYAQWARFESFPLWMEGVAAVERADGGRLHWTANVQNEVATFEGETREWDAAITEQVRDRRISWESVGGAPDEKPSSGGVTFEPLGDSACRVIFAMEWEPEATLSGNESYMLAAVDQVVAADLARFKKLIEGRQEQRPVHDEPMEDR